MQQKLFEQKKEASKGLVIGKTGKQKLTPNQEAFNKLTQRIEKLQKEIAKKQTALDVAMQLYGTEYYPVQQNIETLRYDVILVLYARYKEKKLAKADQPRLKEIILEHIELHVQAIDDEPDAKIKAIVSEFEGMDFDKIVQSQKEDANDQLRKMFSFMNVDMEGVDFDDEKAMEEKAKELAEKMKERESEINEDFFGLGDKSKSKKPRKKTAKQIAHEKIQQQMEEVKQKNIGSVYKQLAKLFHPDLEQDAERKLEKEMLMRELTVAYETKNLHALLMLELKWIHKEQAHLESLTEEKLAVYLQILREQAKELENQKYSLFKQPQYFALFNNFGYDIQRNPVESMKSKVVSLTQMHSALQEEIKRLDSENAFRHLKYMIKDWKRQQKEQQFFDDFDFPF